MTNNPFSKVLREVDVDGKTLKYYSIPELKDARADKLPFCIRVLLESALRNCDNFSIHEADIEKILDWEENCKKGIEIPFKPARVLMQDFTGVPAVVDLAAMRDAIKRLGGQPEKINPLVPVDLVVDHSVQVDVFRSPDAVARNQEREFSRNFERFKFLKWGSKAFEGLQIVPPGSGIVHQVNLEYLARVVFDRDEFAYPDSLVGTDSHTTMINGLGVLGWGVGGIEAEASMLGQPISMVLPKVVGYKLTGKLPAQATSTDLVLTITQNLRKHGVVGKFVEFFGEGVNSLSIADRATLSNMAPEYGATMGFFPVDDVTLGYLRQTGRDASVIQRVEKYLKAQNMFHVPGTEASYTELLELDLGTVVPSLAGPKRPHDRVALSDMKQDFLDCMSNPRGFKGFGIPKEQHDKTVQVEYEGKEYTLDHGSVVIAAITSCTNTSNPSVMLGAGILAKKAVEAGLDVKPYIKTSLSPGSGVVSRYLAESGLQKYLDQIGFNVVGFGCMTCIGNSGELPEPIHDAVQKHELGVASVLSGNRNFEARVHPLTVANYLASPLLVVAYALAGNVKVDFDKEPIGISKDGKEVYLKDIWPQPEEISNYIQQYILPGMFTEVYNNIKNGNDKWNSLEVPEGDLYEWDPKSTYIHNPPFFSDMDREPSPLSSIKNAYCLLNLGDSTTTDHISPAGAIARSSPAAKYLMERDIKPRDFNTYGSRRGNDEVMARGTFANVRLYNKMAGKNGPYAVHVPSGEVMSVFDAAMKYKEAGDDVVVFGGAEYGTGSSRDWAAKGPYLQGVKAVIAVSFERIHRSNLVGMGIVPLQFKDGENTESLNITGKEKFSIDLPKDLKPGQDIVLKIDDGREFTTTLRFDTEVELTYFKHGGILRYVLRNLL